MLLREQILTDAVGGIVAASIFAGLIWLWNLAGRVKKQPLLLEAILETVPYPLVLQ